MTPAYDSMDEALVSVLRALLGEGHVASPRGLETRELLSFRMRLANPRARRIGLPARGWKESLAVGELAWHLAASDSVDFITYYARAWEDFSDDGERIVGSCYGKRIFGGEDSQWERAYRAMRQDSDTRRAVLYLATADSDLTNSRDIACITSIQFLLRDGRLNCVTTMRSCDVIWGFCYDVYLCTMLQELMATRLGVEVGWYEHAVGSLHLYQRFATMAERVVAEGSSARAAIMPRLTAPDALPAFLAVESALRANLPGATRSVDELPEYWQSLAKPLVRLHDRRWKSLVTR